jgi:hypothetical protein
MGLGEKSQIEPSDSSCLFRRGGWRVEPDKARKVIGCVLTAMSRNIHRMSTKTKCTGEFRWAWPGLTSANLISFVRIGAHNGEGQMTKMKTLSAVIILSAAVATPVLAQEAGTRGPGSRYGLESRPFPRGAYNQLNGPSHATPRNGSNVENVGSRGRDPSRVGGQDPSFNPSGT